ncbi:Rv1733c family protein [Actinoplanes sp. CA-030573]|uniref:Rv1733c family protein n=1 Tax=Actinoplanes sp. CA-030573 TaxID=3239898 RepID=UPI003D931850
MRGLLRRLGWDRNPLRRRTDRAEAWLNAVLLIVLLVAGGVLAQYTGRSTYREQARVSAWEREHRFQVWATLLEKPAGQPPTARARWRTPRGGLRTGPVSAPETSAAGAWVPIWVDENGAVVAAPPRRRPATQAAEVAVATVAVVTASLGGVWLFCRRLLDRRRMRYWDAEWLDVGPRWSKYR